MAQGKGHETNLKNGFGRRSNCARLHAYGERATKSRGRKVELGRSLRVRNIARYNHEIRASASPLLWERTLCAKNLKRNLRGEVAWRAIATEVAPTRAERSRTGCAPTGTRCALAAQRYGAGGGFSGVRRAAGGSHARRGACGSDFSRDSSTSHIATEVAPTRAERSRTGCAPTGRRLRCYSAGATLRAMRRLFQRAARHEKMT
jgi:hypothetical protein